MRKLNLCATLTLLLPAASAFALSASLDTALNVHTAIINVTPNLGGSLDLFVDIGRTVAEDRYGDVDMLFQTDHSGITMVGTVGSSNSTGTGTRYNEFEWDTGTNSTAFSPNAFSGPMTAGVPTNAIYSSSYALGDGFWPTTGSPSTTTSNLGHVVINYAGQPAGTNIAFAPVQVHGVNENFDTLDGSGIGVTIHFTPEPASALLLLGAFPFLRRRRTA